MLQVQAAEKDEKKKKPKKPEADKAEDKKDKADPPAEDEADEDADDDDEDDDNDDSSIDDEFDDDDEDEDDDLDDDDEDDEDEDEEDDEEPTDKNPVLKAEPDFADGLDELPEDSTPTSFVGLFGGPESVLELDDLRNQIDPNPPEMEALPAEADFTPSLEERVDQFTQRDTDLRQELNQMADSLLGLVTQLDAPNRRNSAADILVPHRINYIDGPTLSTYASKDSTEMLGLPKAKQDGKKRDDKDRKDDEKETDRLYGRGLRDKAAVKETPMKREAILQAMPLFRHCAAIVERLEGHVVPDLYAPLAGLQAALQRNDMKLASDLVETTKSVLDRYCDQAGMPRTAAAWEALEKVAMQKVAVATLPDEPGDMSYLGPGELADDEVDDRPAEPEEDDITTEDHHQWYQNGRLYFTGDAAGLQAKMEKDGWFPNVWFIDDHGGVELITDFSPAGPGERGYRNPNENDADLDDEDDEA